MQLKKKWTFDYKESILRAKLSACAKEQTKKLFISTKSGKILILDLNSKLVIEEQITEYSPIWNFEISDINKNGKQELILGGLDGLLRVFQITPELILKPLWAHQFGSSISGIRINDINNDDNLEIIAYSLDKTLRVLDNNSGNLIWGQIFKDGIEDAKIWTDKRVKSTKEIIACGNDGTIRIFENVNGNLLWFKQFSDKVRFIDYINSNKGLLIVCGGDDNQLHFIDKVSHNEIKTMEFDDYVWKSLSFPTLINENILISTYSFDYMDQSIPIQDINFTSKLICINKNIEIEWELNNKNIEVIYRFQTGKQNNIAIGTTQGELIIIDEKNGTIKSNIVHTSSINDIIYEPKTQLLIISHEDGSIIAYFIEDS